MPKMKPPIEDHFWNVVLAVESQVEYERFLLKFGRSFSVFGCAEGQKDASSQACSVIRLGEQFLYRRILLRNKGGTGGFRVSRRGLPFSWLEEKLFKWCQISQEKREAPALGVVEVRAISDILQRESHEFLDRIHKRKNQIKGFEICRESQEKK